jgi:hypothetical protein
MNRFVEDQSMNGIGGGEFVRRFREAWFEGITHQGLAAIDAPFRVDLKSSNGD